MVRDPVGNVLALKEYELQSVQELRDIVESEESLQRSYQQVDRGLIHPRQTFIPKRLFQEPEKRQYLEHLTPVEPGDELLANHLEAFDSVNVFLYPEDLAGRVPLQGHAIRHISTILLEGLHHRGLPADEPYLHVHFLPRQLWLVALENAQLKYCNLFPVRSPEDAVYYVLLLFEHMQADPGSRPLHISGRLDPEGRYFQSMAPYLAEPRFLEFKPSLTLGKSMSGCPPYWFFDLLTMGA